MTLFAIKFDKTDFTFHECINYLAKKKITYYTFSDYENYYTFYKNQEYDDYFDKIIDLSITYIYGFNYY